MTQYIKGPSGIGKTSLLAKTADIVHKAYPQTTLVLRHIGLTPDSCDGRSLMQSIFSQIIRVYGFEELKSLITSSYNSCGEEDTSIQDLYHSLESWPPHSLDVLKTAFPIVLSLATETNPITIVCIILFYFLRLIFKIDFRRVG